MARCPAEYADRLDRGQGKTSRAIVSLITTTRGELFAIVFGQQPPAPERHAERRQDTSGVTARYPAIT